MKRLIITDRVTQTETVHRLAENEHPEDAAWRLIGGDNDLGPDDFESVASCRWRVEIDDVITARGELRGVSVTDDDRAKHYAKLIWESDEPRYATIEQCPRRLQKLIQDHLDEIAEKNAKIAEAIDSAYAPLTVNGVIYRSAEKANAVRAALVAEGIPHHYPGTPEARRALRKHGVERTPKIGEVWGCGCERGVIEKFTHDSRAVIRQTTPDGLVPIGETVTIPIHVLSYGEHEPGCNG